MRRPPRPRDARGRGPPGHETYTDSPPPHEVRSAAPLARFIEPLGRVEYERIRAARACLPAARARDGRPELVPEVRGSPAPRASRRAQRPRRDRGSCVARALASPLRGRARLARQTIRISPTTARGYGILGDALVELGRYRDAFTAFDRFAALKPSLASYARVSYAAELSGDIVYGARRAMLLARDAATGEAEPTAWAEWQLGKLAFGHGNCADAERRYDNALTAFPGYVYALDALAQLRAARGRYDPRLRSSSAHHSVFRCRSSSPSSATSTVRRITRSSRGTSTRRSPSSPPPRTQTASEPTSKRHSSTPIHGRASVALAHSCRA